MSVSIDRFSVFLVYVSAACVAFMMTIGVIDTISSKLFNSPLPGYYEITSAAMVLTICLPLSYVQMKGRHLAMTAVTEVLPHRIKLVLELLALVAALIGAVLLTWAGGREAWESAQTLEFYPGSIPFPLYPSKMALAVGVGTLALKLVADVVTCVASLSTGMRSSETVHDK
jgi:TRAP-type C4-dicarboxylate transport system permease small subunit